MWVPLYHLPHFWRQLQPSAIPAAEQPEPIADSEPETTTKQEPITRGYFCPRAGAQRRVCPGVWAGISVCHWGHTVLVEFVWIDWRTVHSPVAEVHEMSWVTGLIILWAGWGNNFGLQSLLVPSSSKSSLSSLVYHQKVLQCIVNAAGKIVCATLPSLNDINNTRLTRKTLSIVDDPTHPSHSFFGLLPSGRRFWSLQAQTTKLKNSLIHQAVRKLNS